MIPVYFVIAHLQLSQSSENILVTNVNVISMKDSTDRVIKDLC